jgi:hypothetical protein
MIKSRMGLAGYLARIAEIKKCIHNFIVKSEEKRPLGRPRSRWVYNGRMDLTEIGFEVMDWIDLVQDRDRWWAVMNMAKELRVPYKAGNVLTSQATVSVSL